MAKRPGPNQSNLEESRRALIDAGIAEFARHGYTDASTNRIVDQCGLARGSLYYHFGDKRGLFRAIYTKLTDESAQAIRAARGPEDDPWVSFMKACTAFIDHAADPVFRKLVLIEAQVALGYRDRLEINKYTLMGAVKEFLKGLMDKNYLPRRDLTAMAVLVFGMLAETGRSFDLTDDVETARLHAREAFLWAMESLRHRI